MVRKGSAYEQFVYDKFREFFPNSAVTRNDRIAGRQSGLEREIDISIKTDVDGKEILYIVQCKDRGKRPADIIILGEFSAVIRDIGAAKGFLICTSGFAKSNYQYAQSIGIELITVEDVRSDRWRADIQIPLIYIKKTLHYALDSTVTVNAVLAAKKNWRPDTGLDLGLNNMISFDNGITSVTIQEWTQEWLAHAGAYLRDSVEIDFPPNLWLYLGGVWSECDGLHMHLYTTKKYYLKYLTPDEYSQVRDHRRNVTLPMHLRISGSSKLDDTFAEVPISDLPVNPVLCFTLEEWTELERVSGRVPPSPPALVDEQQGTVVVPFNTEFPGPDFLSVPDSTK
jgi:Restriction endonuclease